ncbi:hypothetical protein [Brevundimonas sp. PAMC22021]|uniref:hypothetical protein n=1 Tax=Brevundimonas sp. PAMC22021 TaxID=2861285 RepID=UPI00351D3906
MLARLKVFTWSDGFHAFSVATTSRPKALEAWGVGQDLFKAGLAHELEAGPDHDAAMEKPGQVVQRSEAIDVGQIAPAKPKSKAPDNANAQLIKTLKAELDALDQDHADAIHKIDDQIQALESRRAALDKDHDAQRKTLREKLSEARAR